MAQMQLVFLGPPGAGKGTQARLLAAAWSLPHISTGEMLRTAITAGTPLGLKVKETIEAGHLASDEMMLDVVRDRLKHPDCKPGFILDGYPRTLPQAEGLETILHDMGSALTAAVIFEVSEADVRARLEARRDAEGRSDDSINVQLERLRVYELQTAPLVDWYEHHGGLVRVDGSGSVEAVQIHLRDALEPLR